MVGWRSGQAPGSLLTTLSSLPAGKKKRRLDSYSDQPFGVTGFRLGLIQITLAPRANHSEGFSAVEAFFLQDNVRCNAATGLCS